MGKKKANKTAKKLEFLPFKQFRQLTPDAYATWAAENLDALEIDKVDAYMRQLPGGGNDALHRFFFPDKPDSPIKSIREQLKATIKKLQSTNVSLPVDFHYSLKFKTILPAIELFATSAEIERCTPGQYDAIRNFQVCLIAFENQLNERQSRSGFHEYISQELIQTLMQFIQGTQTEVVVEMAAGSGILSEILRQQYPQKGEAPNFYAFDSKVEGFECCSSVQTQTIEGYRQENSATVANVNKLYILSWGRLDMQEALQALMIEAKDSGSHFVIIGDPGGFCLPSSFYDELEDNHAAYVIELPHHSLSTGDCLDSNPYDNIRGSIIRVVCFEGALLYQETPNETIKLLEIDPKFIFPARTPLTVMRKNLVDFIAGQALQNIEIEALLSLYAQEASVDQLDPERIVTLLACLRDEMGVLNTKKLAEQLLVKVWLNRRLNEIFVDGADVQQKLVYRSLAQAVPLPLKADCETFFGTSKLPKVTQLWSGTEAILNVFISKIYTAHVFKIKCIRKANTAIISSVDETVIKQLFEKLKHDIHLAVEGGKNSQGLPILIIRNLRQQCQTLPELMSGYVAAKETGLESMLKAMLMPPQNGGGSDVVLSPAAHSYTLN